MLPPFAVLALAATATVSRQAATWFGVRGPVCPLGHLLGVHPGGFVVAALCVGAVLLHLDVLSRGKVLDMHLRLRSAGRWCFVAGILLAFAARACGCLPTS
jgi:hypothetical protein